MDRIVDSNPDALIISDPGIMRLAKKYMPDTDIHVSTQANSRLKMLRRLKIRFLTWSWNALSTVHNVCLFPVDVY